MLHPFACDSFEISVALRLAPLLRDQAPRSGSATIKLGYIHAQATTRLTSMAENCSQAVPCVVCYDLSNFNRAYFNAYRHDTMWSSMVVSTEIF